MAFRRVEVLRPFIREDGHWYMVDFPVEGMEVRWAWVGVAALKVAQRTMEALGLPELDLPASVYRNERLRFWWTERGWDEYGRWVYHAARRYGKARLRVLVSDDPGVVVGQDAWQVAVLPRSTKRLSPAREAQRREEVKS